MVVSKEIKFYEVTINCLVRTEDCNGESVPPVKVAEIMDLNFDQVDFELGEVKVK